MMENSQKKVIVPKEMILSFALLTFCFALWGAANNMTDLLVTVFKQVKGMSTLEASLIQTAFYGAYFCAPIPAAFIIKRFSYKSGAVAGLFLYAIGAFLCYPASLEDSFSFFLLAFYVFAGGCAIIETSVTPYILGMGPKETATQRVNLAQAFNPVGSISGIMLGKFVILSHLTAPKVMDTLVGPDKLEAQQHDLALVVKAYMMVGVLGLLAGLVIWIKKSPKVVDEISHGSSKASILRLVKNKNYVFAVVAQFFYVSAQIGTWTFVVPYVMQSEIGFDLADDAWWFYFYSILIFLFMRFVCTYIMNFFAPSRLLSLFASIGFLSCLGCIFFTGWIGVLSILMISASMSLMFPTIYGLGLMGTGEDKKIGGSGIIMAIVGGAILVPLQGFMSDGKFPEGDFILNVALRQIFTPIKMIFDSIGFNYSIQTSYYMPLVCFVVIMLFGLTARNKEKELPSL
jgi:FHS family L-fucose permease-like MFS transporter